MDKLAGPYHYTFGVEVFTIGREHDWRETVAPPPCHIMGGQTVPFFKDS